MNRRRKWDMEKIFATILSLAIMVALVAGVMSLINDDDSKEKKNYIDLNEAGSENDEITGLQNANNETTKAFEANDFARNETTEAQTNEPSTESGKWFNREGNEDVTEASSEAGAEVETVTEAETEDDVALETQSQEVAALETEVAAEDLAQAEANLQTNADSANLVAETEVTMPAKENLEAEAAPVTANTATALGYTFGADSSLMWPVLGDVVLSYNMTNTVYFPTLGVYKCNPAIIIGCEEGTLVSAATDGIVMSVYEDEETGLTMEVAIGNDYVLTYGQLKDLTVGVGSQIKTGDVIASVAAPTSYYTVEGTNLYLRLDSAEAPLDPMEYIEVVE